MSSKEEGAEKKMYTTANPATRDNIDDRLNNFLDLQKQETSISTEDTIQTCVALTSVKNRISADGFDGIRENKRKASVYSLVNFDVKGSTNEISNLKQINQVEKQDDLTRHGSVSETFIENQDNQG